jgi:hypothetical protein
VVLQLTAGLVNLALLAPVWMQLLHLLLADAVWLAAVLLGASALAEDAPRLAVPGPGGARVGVGTLTAETWLVDRPCAPSRPIPTSLRRSRDTSSLPPRS